ncbi:Mov34/MPN/PAD-1 family protein [Syntrophotalea acetylenivorans]|uniref:Mov34/MPN/PAD-1 family protein n=1 Tax=Syntrophotalea acetylenivorans TaxID=1842532 RepID=UPI00092FE1FD|nr:Mov34/MPN/PAD-1 family protein [Syntrophotalea acetylenivorans]
MRKRILVAQSVETKEPTDTYKEHVWSCEGYSLAIPENLYTELLSFRQLNREMMESGGFIIGRRISGTQTSVADEISTPMREDFQTRSSFFRNYGHIDWLKNRWKATHQTGQLLATWHTHPEPIPSPSSTDYGDWRNVLKKCVLPGVPVYFVIVGQEQIVVWRGLKRKFSRQTFSTCSFEGVIG